MWKRELVAGEVPANAESFAEKGKTATLVTFQSPTPARESMTWMRAPSRSLMWLLLSQCLTPATPRRGVGFFGSGR